MKNESLFNQAEVKYYEGTDATIAYRKFGSGFPIIFIHGFPVYGYTWRHILPELQKEHTCYVLDLPGLGLSKWTEETDFHFKAQASRIIDFLKFKGIDSCSLIAQDTGATTARIIALRKEIEIKTLVLFNTEVPNHRPPWIPFYQKSSLLPLSHYVFKASMKNKWFVKSSLGFKAFYADKSLLDIKSNLAPYLDLATNSNHQMKGALSYLRGCDLAYMDTLKERHKDISAKVILIWGEKDVTFPVKYGAQLAKQFTDAEFHRIQEASLMPHEEKPMEVLEIIKSKLM